MPLTTVELLASLHQQTESYLQKAVADWQMLPEQLLTAPPAPGRWSVAQCLEHLNIYGRYYLPAIEKAIQSGRRASSRPADNYHPGWLGAYFTRLMRPRPDGGLQSTMQSPKNALPAAEPDARAMLAEFIDQQEKMLQLLDAAAAVNLHRVRVPVSIAPWLRLQLGDIFSFVIAHTERHMRQAERALEARQRPAVRA